MDLRATSLRFGWLHAGLPPGAGHVHPRGSGRRERAKPAGRYGLLVSYGAPVSEEEQPEREHAVRGRLPATSSAAFRIMPPRGFCGAVQCSCCCASPLFGLAISSSVILLQFSLVRSCLTQNRWHLFGRVAMLLCFLFSASSGRVDRRFYIAISLALPPLGDHNA
uniref:Uncharacterized protein n=1 Tax=Setaria viridis TaxID=4556 RepID=A0A4U6W0K5_SETVI|nr:hypothetical protein SEVIR_2G371200v2 [Setaria viridis]